MVLRFLKIIRTPHFFAALSSTFVHFGASKTHGCTHSQKYLAKVSKDNTHPARFYCSFEYPCTLRNAKNARLHAFSEIFGIKVSKDNAHPARFYCSFEYLRTLRGVKNARLHAFSEIFKQRFLKIIRTPHFFAVLSSTFVRFGASKTHGCTHSQKYLAKVSKDNTHPARFYCSFEYPCKMCSRRQRKLR